MRKEGAADKYIQSNGVLTFLCVVYILVRLNITLMPAKCQQMFLSPAGSGMIFFVLSFVPLKVFIFYWNVRNPFRVIDLQFNINGNCRELKCERL